MTDIVLTTYNGEAYLEEQLDSLLAQTVSDLRILVFDDGSRDQTEEIVRAYAERDRRVIWHRNQKNMGYTMNFLCGIRHTEAEYVMLCDQDDIWYPDKVEKTLLAMKQAETEKNQPVLVFGDAEVYNGRTSENRSFQRESHLDTKKVDLSHLLMENKCIGCTVMINRGVADRLTHLPTDIRVHDWWLALIASAFGKVVYLDEMLLKYRQHEGNQIGGTSFSAYVKDRLSSVGRQREQVRATYRQGRVFYAVFRDELTGRQRRIAEAFATMEQVSWVRRRARMIRYGFTKSGWLRNIGLWLLM